MVIGLFKMQTSAVSKRYQRGSICKDLRMRSAGRAPMASAAAAAQPEVKTREERISDTKVRVTISIPPDMNKKEFRNVLKHWNNKIAVTGFRKGHAPDNILIEQLGGRQAVYNTVMTELIQNVIGGVLERSPLASSAIADSEEIEQTGEQLEAAFDLERDFTFSITFQTMPQIRWKSDYRDIAVTVEAASDDARDQKTAEKRFRALLKEGGTLRVVTGRGVQMGDVTIVDFDATAEETKEAIPGASRRGMQLDTETADEEFIPDIVDVLLGMETGETRERTITLPDSEEFQPASLRGKKALVKLTLSEMFEWDLPEVSDEWAAGLMGPGSTVGDIKQRLLENAKAESDKVTQQRVADALTEAVGNAVDAPIPDVMIQEAGQNEYSRKLNDALQKGLLPYEQAQKLASPQLVAAFVKQNRPELENLQRASLGFADVLAREGVVITPEDIESEYMQALNEVKSMNPDGPINEEGLREQVARGLETQAAMDWLVANCKVDILPPGLIFQSSQDAEKSESSASDMDTEADQASSGTTASMPKTSTRRQRGRPKGSKNKSTALSD